MEGAGIKSDANAGSSSKESGQSEVTSEDAFIPLDLSKTSQSNQENKESECLSLENEQRLQDLLKTINSESLQLNTFLSEENKLVNEICVSLSQIMKKLRVSFDIPVRDIPDERKIKRAILKDEGYLRLLYEKDDEKSALLAEYSPEVVIAVLWDVMPELAKAITVYRKKIGARAGFFERIKKELKNVAKTVIGSPDENSLQTNNVTNPADPSKTTN